MDGVAGPAVRCCTTYHHVCSAAVGKALSIWCGGHHDAHRQGREESGKHA
jgi:hypothetical protein